MVTKATLNSPRAGFNPQWPLLLSTLAGGVIMNQRDPFADNPDEILAVYLIINGSLEMSAGKIAAQCFQVAQRLLRAAEAPETDPNLVAALADWERQGTRTITRIALSETLFERVCHDLDGVLMVDEGLTEVPANSATVFATWPLRRGELPRMLRHRSVPLLDATLTKSKPVSSAQPS